MATSTSLRGHLRTLLHLPPTLSRTAALLLSAEKTAPNRIGTWKCACGHQNFIYLHSEPTSHPFGLLQCRRCPLSWHPFIALKVTSPNLMIFPHVVQPSTTDSARILPPPLNACTTLGYVCLGYSCGLTWRTETKTEWFSGKRRRVLLVDGKRAKGHCDCGIKIFEAGRYVVFKLVPRSSVGPDGLFAVEGREFGDAMVGRVSSAPGAGEHVRNDSGVGGRMSID
jgi:hypothetical protein